MGKSKIDYFFLEKSPNPKKTEQSKNMSSFIVIGNKILNINKTPYIKIDGVRKNEIDIFKGYDFIEFKGYLINKNKLNNIIIDNLIKFYFDEEKYLFLNSNNSSMDDIMNLLSNEDNHPIK